MFCLLVENVNRRTLPSSAHRAVRLRPEFPGFSEFLQYASVDIQTSYWQMLCSETVQFIQVRKLS